MKIVISNILELPNEVLLIIFNKLHMVDVLYSLLYINERFDQLVLNSLHIRHLDMTMMTVKSVFNYNFSIDNQVLDRICIDIIPRIRHQVKKLTIVQHSMERVLLSANYPELYSLSLIGFQEDVLFEYLTSK
jgi:hypothetical protein